MLVCESEFCVYDICQCMCAHDFVYLNIYLHMRNIYVREGVCVCVCVCVSVHMSEWIYVCA